MTTKAPDKSIATREPSGKWLAEQMFSLAPKTMEEAMKFSELIAGSSIVPACYKGKAMDVLVAVQMGAELGLKPLQALQNIAIINGKPSVYGDSFLAIIQAHPLYDGHEEYFEGDVAVCRFRRKGCATPFESRFGDADAKTAGLLGKAGPWTNYPKRMKQMRARGFAGRDAFADALKGIITREEAEDYPQTVARTPDAEVVERAPKSASPIAGPETAPPRETTAAEPAKTAVGSNVTSVKRYKSGAYVVTVDGRNYDTTEAVASYAKAAMTEGRRVECVFDDGEIAEMRPEEKQPAEAAA